MKIHNLLLITLLLLTACNDPSSPNLRFGLATAPVSLDPRFATDATSVRITRLIYHALVDFDASLRPIPDLATWESLDATHYRFHLGTAKRQFHNGTLLTAHDVKATYDYILNATNASPHRSSLTIIQKIQIVDNDTMDFILTKPDALFPGRLMVGIVPAALIQKAHPFNKQPIGSGPLEFVHWPHTSQLYLKRRQDGQLFEFLEIKDPVVRVLKLIRGEIDMLQNDLSPELITWLAKRAEIKISQVPGSNFTYIGFNLQDAAMKQLPVRQAIAYALNREDLVHYVLGNAARIESSFLLPATHWAGHPNLPSYTHNPEKARQLLAQAGFTAKNPLHLVYKTSNNPFRVRLATAIQQQLATVGIQVELRSYDWGTFYADIKTGRFQMFSLSWVGVKMPDIFRYAFHSSNIPPQGANRGRLNNPQIDAVIERAELAPTLEEQAVIYRELQTLLFQQLPYIPLWYEDHLVAIRQGISGYTLTPDGNYDNLKVTVKRYIVN